MALRAGQLQRKVWQTFRGVLDIIHLLPSAAAVVVCTLLATDPQLHELYLSYLGQRDALQIVCAVAGFFGVSVAIYGAHSLLVGIRRNENYADPAGAATGLNVKGRVIYSNFRGRNVHSFLRWLDGIFGVFWSLLPWLGLGLGTVAATVQVWRDDHRLNDELRQIRANPAELFSEQLIYAVAVALLIFAGISLVLMLALRKYESMNYKSLRRRSKRYGLALRLAFWGLVSLLIAVAAYLPSRRSDFVTIYREVGPLATLSVEFLFIIAILTGIAWLSEKSKFPALTLVVTAIAIGAIFNIPFGGLTLWFGLACFVLFWLALSSPLKWEALILAVLCLACVIAHHRDAIALDKPDPNSSRPSADQGSPAQPKNMIRAAFRQWLAQRTDKPGPASAPKPYPVFIIAAQGGGIYAAASAALFLARLQDSQPCFVDHVFAISGVSGGAIGATIFQALARPPAPAIAGAPGISCAQRSGTAGAKTDGPLTDTIKDIMEDDYFSPVVSAIIPDLVGEQWGRAETLERGFLESVDRKDPQAALRLSDWYINHWGQGANPALVLNTTSAETGYRVALAPFGLSDSGDRSLYSFADSQFAADSPAAAEPALSGQLPDTKPPLAQCPDRSSTAPAAGPSSTAKTADGTSIGENVPLMFGAVASARFPFILPPYSMSSKCGNRLNFVDGGYADNSGAQTALDLYRALAPEDDQSSSGQPGGRQPDGPAAKPQDPSVDIKIILITSDDPLPDLRQISGTDFGDTVAPISALLQVREGLGDQAVARVCDYFRETEKGEVDANCNTPKGKPWKLDLVRIQDQAYGLPLGWKISDSTVTLLSSLIGRSDDCQNVAASSERAKDILSNSCVLRDVAETLLDYQK